MSALPRTRPQNLRDLAMRVAIIRPGPVVGKFVNPYIERRLGRQPVTYIHPLFQDFTERTRQEFRSIKSRSRRSSWWQET